MTWIAMCISLKMEFHLSLIEFVDAVKNMIIMIHIF